MFQTQYKRDHSNDGEIQTDKVSKTIPDQTMPVIEIMRRYTNGLPLGGGIKNPIWQGEDSGIPANWDKMDISEKQEFMEQNLTNIEIMRQDLLDQQNKTGAYKPQPTVQEINDKEIVQPAPSAGSSTNSSPK